MPNQPLPYYVNYLPVLLQIVVACLVAGGMVVLSALVGKHRYGRTKMQAYECGMVGTGDARQRFSVKFYMVAMLFILFDVEAIFLIPWAVIYRKLPADFAAEAQATTAPLKESKRIVYVLAALFSLDAFAGGFVVQSLLALWLFQKFDLSLGAASAFFFGASLLSAISFPVAAWLARHIGLVNTMVFTHIPSSICLVAVAFSSNLTVVLVLLLVRSALSQMDVPTRSSYVMAVVTPAERTAAASVTAVPRSLASSISPAIAGFMLAGPFSGLPLVVCGSLKIIYDLALLGLFRHTKPPEES